jgi:4-amino-4-deoxy-L-arabinose transferase-like glycosyltransferase
MRLTPSPASSSTSPALSPRLVLAAIWCAFLLRGVFYCVEQPLWEGFDEWAHFAVIQHVAEHGSLPSRADLISPAVQRSLSLAPLSQAAAGGIPDRMTHDSFWRLPPKQRIQFQEALLALSSSSRTPAPIEAIANQYEAQQLPLYYLLLTPLFLATRGLSLVAQVLCLRMASVLIASLIVPLVFAVCRNVLPDVRFALLVALLTASLPGLFIDTCRVANDGLAVVAASAVILYAIKASRPAAGLRVWVILGLLMGAALLTKAYLLVFVALLPLAAVLRIAREPSKRRIASGCAMAIVTCLVIGAWWYVRAWWITGTVSGEQLDAQTARLPLAQKLSSVLAIDWRKVFDDAVRSHIWVGAWSFLVVHAWMYRVFELVGLIAIVGLFAFFLRLRLDASRAANPSVRAADVALLLAAWVLICLVVAYHSFVVFLTQSSSTAQGWYLYPGLASELTLIAVGFLGLVGERWSPRCLALLCLLALALDVYTLHYLLAPYYTGIISHNARGALALTQPETRKDAALVFEILRRLSSSKPAVFTPPAIGVLWGLYLAASATLAATALLLGFSPAPSPRGERS